MSREESCDRSDCDTGCRDHNHQAFSLLVLSHVVVLLISALTVCAKVGPDHLFEISQALLPLDKRSVVLKLEPS